MPKLFISYKRKTNGVEKLKDDLRAEKYALWFDRDDIHIGDSDWQAKIEAGLRECSGMVLCLTPLACESEPIRFEVRKALEFKKPIFPMMLEAIKLPDGLIQIGLPERTNVSELMTIDNWDQQFQKLLVGLREQGINVTAHDLRQQRGEKEYHLHQAYLAKLIQQVGRVQLSAINPDHTQADGVPLEDIYVSLPTKMAISAEIENFYIKADWWIAERSQEIHVGRPRPESIPTENRTRPKGWTDLSALEALVDAIQIQLDEERQHYWAERQRTESANPPFYISLDDGIFSDYIHLDACDAAAACPRLVILGGPGSGKTSFVRHLALCLAGEQWINKTRKINLAQIGQWSHGELVPVYVELRHLIGTMLAEDVTTQPHVDTFWSYVKTHILGTALTDYASSLRNDLDGGRGLIILDGLDEVPYPRGKGNLQKRQLQLKSLVQALEDAFGQTRILVASRPYAYEGWSLPGFSSVELAPFEDQQREQLTANLYRASGDTTDAANEQAKRLNQDLQAKNISRELRDTPLFITLMATVYAAGGSEGLPTRKGALYRQSILLLLERWTKAKPGTPTLAELLGNTTRDDLLSRLAALAYAVHERFGEEQTAVDIPRELLSKHIFEMEMDDPSVKAAQLVSYLSENAGVLVSPGHQADGHVFRFAHRTFQEYLAAKQIVAECTDSYEPVREYIESHTQLWRIPCLLVGDVLRDRENARDAYEDLWSLIETLCGNEVHPTIKSDDPCWWSVWLAGEIILEQELEQQDVTKLSGKRYIRKNFVNWLLKLIETPQVLPPKERAACGRVLSHLGDPRSGVCLDPNTGLPQIVWCDVPAGSFLTSSDLLDPSSFKRHAAETLQYSVALGSYRISQYLITYAQYEAFVNSDGYHNRAYWTEAGWSWREDKTQPENCWNDPQWHLANHPVVGVTWYEAHAYCRWLTANLGYEIRLPTEVEWERAASGDDGQIYPYGSKFDANKGNYIETEIGRSSAVGLFPDGVSPNGLQDMSGNVWQWCLNKWRVSYNDPEDNDPEGKDNRCLRGGSWSYFAGDGKAASRLWAFASDNRNEYGFRVCCPNLELNTESS
ncbi:MAG: SUMF1/EgtB/PvdO family nonheme iron enzyme [Chloroflexi bacterium]|nr:SUMF1/EgtB/PvdO family nonheme iron enzyme [Chloroflexota bacterium]